MCAGPLPESTHNLGNLEAGVQLDVIIYSDDDLASRFADSDISPAAGAQILAQFDQLNGRTARFNDASDVLFGVVIHNNDFYVSVFLLQHGIERSRKRVSPFVIEDDYTDEGFVNAILNTPSSMDRVRVRRTHCLVTFTNDLLAVSPRRPCTGGWLGMSWVNFPEPS